MVCRNDEPPKQCLPSSPFVDRYVEKKLFVIDGPPRDPSIADPDGNLNFPYSLKGVNCPRCGGVSADQHVLPMACPRQIAIEVQSIYESTEYLTTDEFDLIHKRWQMQLAETNSNFKVGPGNRFSDAIWNRKVKGRNDFYWPLFGPVCADPIRDALLKANFTGIAFGSLTTRDKRRRKKDPPDDSSVGYKNNDTAIDASEGATKSYSLVVVTLNTFDIAQAEFGGHRCKSCGIIRHAKERNIEYRCANGIAQSKMRLPNRWTIDSDFFESHVFGMGSLIVKPHVHALLKEIGATGFRARELSVDP